MTSYPGVAHRPRVLPSEGRFRGTPSDRTSANKLAARPGFLVARTRKTGKIRVPVVPNFAQQTGLKRNPAATPSPYVDWGYNGKIPSFTPRKCTQKCTPIPPYLCSDRGTSWYRTSPNKPGAQFEQILKKNRSKFHQKSS